MAFDVGSLLGGLGQVLPSTNELANQVALGAATSVVLAGLKSQAGLDAVDPLHIFHKDGSSTVVGKTIPASALATLSADQIKALSAEGYSFV